MSESTFITRDSSGVFRRNKFLTVLIFTSFVAFCVTIFFNYASNVPSLGIFNRTNADVSNENALYITPAGWTFATWGLIYIWQAAWLICMMVFVFIKTESGGHLFMDPVVLTPTFYILIIKNFTFNITWIFLFTQENFWFSFAVLLALTLTLYAALVISHKNVYLARNTLDRKNSEYIWLYRVLVNNGLAFYATWVSVASMINFGIALLGSGVSKEVASIVPLSILAIIIAVYFVLDLYLFEVYLRYTYSPYLQLLIAFSGVLSENWHYQNSTAILTLVLTIVGPCLMFILKVALVTRKLLRNRN